MSDPKARKILIAGDVRGNIASLYKRVVSVNASPAGPFHALFCVGPFFTSDAENDDDAAAETTDELQPYLDGTSVAPIPTYFLDAFPGGRGVCGRDEKLSGKIALNITFLRTPEVCEIAGLRVAVLPGHYNPINWNDESALASAAAREEGEFTKKDVTSLKQSHLTTGSGAVDLLLTADWPRGVCAFARDKTDGGGVSLEKNNGDTGEHKTTTPSLTAAASGSPACAELARELQPRYHVSSRSGVFYQREPYRNQKGHVTRFIGLGAVGNSNKTKWLHALALTPAREMAPSALHKSPADTTSSPYVLPAGASGGRNLPGPPGVGEKRPFGVDADEFDRASVRWEDAAAKKTRLTAGTPDNKRPLKGDIALTVYVRNLNFRADENAVGSFFAGCGDIVDLKLGRGEDGRSRGFCHVVFGSTEAVEKALGLTDNPFFGRDITVAMAKSEKERGDDRDARRGTHRNGTNATPPTGCWFCLSNEKDTHLVASIAGESFVSMDKGGLVADHCQVVPVEHTPSFASLSPSAAAEVWSYIACVRKMLNDGGGGSNDTVDANHCAAPRDLVVFERHLALRSKGGNHVHMNCVPVPREKANKARKIFEQAAKRLGFEWDVFDAPTSAEQLQALLQEKAGDDEYYCVHLPDGQILFRLIKPKEPHWMSFGREVLGHLLGCPERTAWQECMESETAETSRAEKFKNAFEKYDEPAKNALG